MARPSRVAGDTIGLLFDSPRALALVEGAAGHWRACSQHGSGFPAFRVGETGMINIRILYAPGSTGEDRCASFSAGIVRLYEFSRSSQGHVSPCGSLAQNLAHELGHVLGLADTPSTGTCRGRIMGGIHGFNSHSRRVHQDECRLVDLRWLTTGEYPSLVLPGPDSLLAEGKPERQPALSHRTAPRPTRYR